MSDYLHFQSNRYYKESDISNKQATKYIEHDPRHQLRILHLFKELIGSSMNLALRDKSCFSDDNFLKRFLYARKFDCDEALQLLINYLSFKENNKELLQKINIFDEQIRLALLDGNPGVLKQRDRKGRKVITFTASNWNTQNYNLEDIYRAFLLSLDKLLENIENQALGFVVIVDWTNITFKQSTHLSPRILKLMIEGLQNCMPVKFKGIHYVAQPWHVDLSLTVMKPFLSEKIKKHFMLHGTNLTTLHSFVSKDILPPDLGGEGPNINTLDWYHYLLESSQTTETPKSYRLITTAVYTKVPRDSESSEKDNNTDESVNNSAPRLIS